jgi:peroxiredoxin
MKIHAVVYALLLATAAGLPADALEPADAAPDFVLKSVDGENIRLSEYRGQVVMLSFWASWCGDCRAQLRALNDVQARYRDAGFELLALSLDTERRQAADAAAALELTLPVLHDAGGEVGRVYEVDTVPYVVLVDREGRVRHVVEGFGRDSEELYLEHVRGLLRE